MSAAATKMTAPARLECNNAGAWKSIALFDLGSPGVIEQVKNAATALGDIGNEHGRVLFRIVSADGKSRLIADWSPSTDWRGA